MNFMECPVCQLSKPETDFPLRGGKRRRSYCKECFRRKYNDPYYLRNKDRYRRNESGRRKQMCQRVLAYLKDHPCVDCGEPDPVVLEFDHVRGVKGYNISRGIGSGYSWEKLLHEIAKCEVRCANCHRRVTAKRGNWYKQ